MVQASLKPVLSLSPVAMQSRISSTILAEIQEMPLSSIFFPTSQYCTHPKIKRCIMLFSLYCFSSLATNVCTSPELYIATKKTRRLCLCILIMCLLHNSDDGGKNYLTMYYLSFYSLREHRDNKVALWLFQIFSVRFSGSFFRQCLSHQPIVIYLLV